MDCWRGKRVEKLANMKEMLIEGNVGGEAVNPSVKWATSF